MKIKKEEGDGRRGLPQWICVKTSYVTKRVTVSFLAWSDLQEEPPKGSSSTCYDRGGKERRGKENFLELWLGTRFKVGENLCTVAYSIGFLSLYKR